MSRQFGLGFAFSLGMIKLLSYNIKFEKINYPLPRALFLLLYQVKQNVSKKLMIYLVNCLGKIFFRLKYCNHLFLLRLTNVLQSYSDFVLNLLADSLELFFTL